MPALPPPPQKRGPCCYAYFACLLRCHACWYRHICYHSPSHGIAHILPFMSCRLYECSSTSLPRQCQSLLPPLLLRERIIHIHILCFMLLYMFLLLFSAILCMSHDGDFRHTGDTSCLYIDICYIAAPLATYIQIRQLRHIPRRRLHFRTERYAECCCRRYAAVVAATLRHDYIHYYCLAIRRYFRGLVHGIPDYERTVYYALLRHAVTIGGYRRARGCSLASVLRYMATEAMRHFRAVTYSTLRHYMPDTRHCRHKLLHTSH